MHTGSLFTTAEELTKLSRQLARLGFALSIISALILGGLGIFMGSELLYQAIGPIVIAFLLGVMILARREHAPTIFLLAGSSVVVSFRFVGTPSTAVAATTAVVVIAILSALFVRTGVVRYALVMAGALFAVPHVWSASPESALPTGVVMAVSFVVGSAAIAIIRTAAIEASERYRDAFERAPIPLLEMEWGAAVSVLSDLDTSLTSVAEILEANQDLVVRVISAADIVRVNQAAAALMGFNPSQEIKGKVINEFMTPALIPVWTEQLIALSNGAAVFESEFQLSRYGQERTLAVRTVSNRRRGDSYRSVVSFTDVTASRVLEENLKHLIEAKDEFIASVSHELRTPLTAVVGLSQELAGAGEFDASETAELLGIISSQSTEMAYIVEDLLVGARADNGTITVRQEQVNISELVLRVNSELTFGASIDDRLGRDWMTIGDRVRIRQIVRNLFINAERYGGPGREVVLYEREGMTVVEVRDSGEALPALDADRIFSPYESAHSRKGVTAAMGLGLSVSRQLAQLMGGDLAYFHDGQTVFSLSLPCAASTEAAAPVSAAQQH